MYCLVVISNRLTVHATICYLKNVDLVIFISLCYRRTLFQCQTPLYGVHVHKTDVDLQPSVVSLVLLIVHHHLSLLFSWRMGLSICVHQAINQSFAATSAFLHGLDLRCSLSLLIILHHVSLGILFGICLWVPMLLIVTV